MADAGPRLDQMNDGQSETFVLSGAWVARYSETLQHLAELRPGHVSRLIVDAARIDRIDSFGAWCIRAFSQSASASGISIQLVGLPPGSQLALQFLGQTQTAPSRRHGAWEKLADALETFGRNLSAIFFDLLALLSMVGRIVFSMLSILRRPDRLRWRSVIHHVDQAGVRAVPIVALMTFLIGCIISQQGFFHFQRFGATDYVVDLVTILVLREIGVLLVTIMVAGRSGSACTAEIGSMKMREEVDALRTMGLDPIDVLVAPRMLAFVIALPMLTFIGILSSLLGAAIVAAVYADMSFIAFSARLKEVFTFGDFEVGMIKAPVMALVIGIVASLEGLRVEGSAASLGIRTTASVVKTIFLVIVLDGIFAMLFAAVGM